MHFLRDRRRGDSSECGSDVSGDQPSRETAIEGAGEILLYNVSDVGALVPDWVREAADGEIFAPNLTTLHRSGRWCLARFRDFLWGINRAPLVACIRDAVAFVSECFEVFGWGSAAHMRLIDTIYRLIQIAVPSIVRGRVRLREGAAMGEPSAETTTTSRSTGEVGVSSLDIPVKEWGTLR